VAEPPISIVVPCYNEAARLPVASFREFVAQHDRMRFLFVNDGSHDDTSAVLQRMHDGDPTHFSFIELAQNRGKAEAVRAGMMQALASDAAFAGYWDADLATPLSEIPRFVHALDDNPGYEICFGSRVRLLGRAIDRNPYRHYLGRLFATVASQVLRLPVYDTQCGAKLFRVTANARAIFAEPFTVNWTFDVEIIARVQAQRSVDARASRPPMQRLSDARARRASVIYELPLNEWRDVAGSKVHARDFFRSLFEMLRIYTKYRGN
jgi:glycosyltransferase involved in cell wall biosynthesis